METKDLRDLVRFSDEAATAHTLFETGRLWSQVICLERNQQHGPMSDPGADAILTVVAGEVVIQVNRTRKRIRQWGAVLARAGGTVWVTNASLDPAVVLVVTAPPPVRPG